MALPDPMTLATRAEIQAVRDGLAFLSVAAESGRFSWDDYEAGIAGCDARLVVVPREPSAFGGHAQKGQAIPHLLDLGAGRQRHRVGEGHP